MPAHSVRIYDPTLWQWIQREAERRGPGVRTSDVAESALALLRSSLEGSDAPEPEVQAPTGDPLRGGKSSDRRAQSADVVSGEAVVQPVPALDPREGLDFTDLNTLTRNIVDAAAREDLDRALTPVQRVKGPDSGPDDELGF